MSTSQHVSDSTYRERIADQPLPLLRWLAGALALVLLEIGAVLSLAVGTLDDVVSFVLSGDGAGALTGAAAWADSLPTLLSRELIPNRGYFTGEVWTGTFLGLEPKHAWLLRVLLILVYGLLWLGWLWKGYTTYRQYYRAADWTPTDDIIDRLRNHQWGQFGFAIVVLFLLMAIFAPAISPTTMDQNIRDPYSYEVQYFDEDAGEVQSVTVGEANRQSISKGSAERNVGPWRYDDFDRFHPFGTLPSGKDLFTFLAYGARISLFIGVTSMAVAGTIAMAFSMISSFYKGAVDLLLVLTSDSVQALPVLMVLILAAVVFSDTWLASVYNGALLFIALFALIYWPYLWRAVRGPAFQVAEEEWIDAAKNYGQHPAQIMRKHMAPYIVGYMLIYASLTLGGVIISVAGLSFLGLGITPPTPEWGRAISEGQPYVASHSWHISLIPGFLITLVVTAFNALGDGIRDAIDPQSTQEDESATVAAGGGGA